MEYFVICLPRIFTSAVALSSDYAWWSNTVRHCKQCWWARRVDIITTTMWVNHSSYHTTVSSHDLLPASDCRENGRIQDFYHPGLFNSGKWSCCDHKSRHSYGCQPSFLRNEPTSSSSSSSFSPPMSPTRLVGGGAGPYRGPLPPTPQSEPAAPPSDSYSSSQYPPAAAVSSYQQQRSSHNVSSYQHTNPQLDPRGLPSQSSHAAAEAPPPPLPVSVSAVVSVWGLCI